jgi:hypothetical protein
VRCAVERVLIDDINGASVGLSHFRRAYEVFSGCNPDQNIMAARNWTEIHPMNALLREEELARVRAMEAMAERDAKLHGKHHRQKSKDV